MPRIATEQSAETIKARRALEAYLREPGRSQVALSRDSSIAQPTISKFLSGRIKSLTPDVRAVMKVANIGIKGRGATLSADARIQRALGEAWDGTEAGTQLLARAIEALGGVLRDATAHKRGGTRA
ncbi:hypothetical protein [Scleromatobacter humisilvae]|uniref:Uncharacterized protein n=1 Tax=Scleromatobacter humisilvae TaxID=2897159 RepID=A0A9X2BYK5_9BURK|nr:hypothetical protein [Scleromatobacter humisilvae]MCK9685713.1 hypothetical protein [Scleromatobacter humisilvae]